MSYIEVQLSSSLAFHLWLLLSCGLINAAPVSSYDNVGGFTRGKFPLSTLLYKLLKKFNFICVLEAELVSLLLLSHSFNAEAGNHFGLGAEKICVFYLWKCWCTSKLKRLGRWALYLSKCSVYFFTIPVSVPTGKRANLRLL